MKISDAVIDLINKGQAGPYIITDTDDREVIIIPKFDHELCYIALRHAGKKESKGSGWYKRELECNRVANALDKDIRFEKFIHFTGRKAYRYKY